MSKWIIFSLAIGCYGSAIWGAVLFFRTADEGAEKGKTLISLLGGMGMSLVIWQILISTANLWQSLTAAGFYCLSIALFWLAWRACRHQEMQFAFSNKKPFVLIQHGIYTRIRHPFYASYICGWIAPIFHAPHAMTISIFAVMTGLYYLAARREEKTFLVSSFQDEYRCYMQTTGLFFPWWRGTARRES